MVWQFCGARNSEKLEALNKRILRFIFKDYSSSYPQLPEKVNFSSYVEKEDMHPKSHADCHLGYICLRPFYKRTPLWLYGITFIWHLDDVNDVKQNAVIAF